jgi:hypothetical protein
MAMQIPASSMHLLMEAPVLGVLEKQIEFQHSLPQSTQDSVVRIDPSTLVNLTTFV